MQSYARLLTCTALVLVATSSLVGCDGCAETPEPPASECVLDGDCPLGQLCTDGMCAGNGTPSDAGPGDAGPSDAGPGDAGPPVLGILSALPEPDVEFGATRLGVPVERNVTLKNTGTVPLRVLQLSLDDDSGTFAATPTGFLDTELAPDQELGVQLVHTPNDGLPDSAQLEVLHTGEGGLLQVDLFAEFKGTPTLSLTRDVAVLTPDEVAVDFGAVPVGSAAAVRLLVRNDGSVDSVLSVSGAVTVPGASAFALAPVDLDPAAYLSSWDGDCASSATCPADAPDCVGGFCLNAAGLPPDTLPLMLTFTPTASGTTTATLTISTNADGVPTQTDVVLTGEGVTGLLVATPAAVTFADAFVGRTDRRTVNLSNQGQAPVEISAFDFVPSASSPFVVQHPLPALPHTLAPAEGFDLDVVFTPLSAGQFARTLAVRTDGEQDTTIEVVGNARVAPVVGVLDEATLDELPPEGLVYGDHTTGFPVARSLRLLNLGPPGSVLTVTRLAIDGPQAARFSFSPSTIATPLPGSINFLPYAALDVEYRPGALTGLTDTAQLIIETDDPDLPAVTVPLSGRSVQPIVEVAPETIDFGPVLVGTTPSPTRTFTVRNIGPLGDLVVTDVSVPGQTAFVRALSQPLPAVLRQSITGDALTVTLTFTPTTASFLTSTLNVATNDHARPVVTVAVGGGGSSCPARANASVTVVGSDCVYTCNGGYHACGDSCLANTSPDSCGTLCTPCVARSNADRGCVAATSACTYSCDNPFYDLNSDRNVSQAVSSDGCEYQCDVASPTTEQCDNLDNDCDGTPDDGLPLEANEPVNTCSASAVNFGDVNDNNSPVTFTGYKIYPAGDEDHFRFRAHEDEFNFCLGSEPYRTTIELLDIPAGRDFDLQVRDGSCSGTVFTSQAGGNLDESLVLDWSGSCGSDDDKTFYVRVYPYPVAGPDDSCFAYRLRITHDRR
ncbi:MAG: choice-of-anchor D domain-containing protein [Deltaproteobacteria bacterium]|nr:choice-of-anchor D domain-containing protein [Deltaproteobacteria bacterium]